MSPTRSTIIGPTPAGPDLSLPPPAEVRSSPGSGVAPDCRQTPPRRSTLVWLDVESATVARWIDGPRLVRLDSQVPMHHKSTGHVRHDPLCRHGGGGSPQKAGDPHRIEHLREFVKAVAAQIPTDEDVEILGPGTVREQLAAYLQGEDRRHGHVRAVRTEPAEALTTRQLVARLRVLVGANPPRRTVGAYRWSHLGAGKGGPVEPRRVAEKPARRAE